MDYAAHVDWVGDGTFPSAIRYCQDLGAKHLFFGFEFVPGYREQGWFDAVALRSIRSQIEEAGLSAGIMNLRPPQSAVLGEREGRAWLTDFGRCLESIAECGGGTVSLHLTANLPDASWSSLVVGYRALMAAADRSGIPVAIHTTAERERNLLWDWASVKRLFEEVPSDMNGLTFCVGNLWRSEGERIYDLIGEVGDRLKFVHVRSTRPETGQQEYWLDTVGGPDFVRIVRALDAIGYTGAVFPEHLPHVVGENRWDISTAWAMGYLRGLRQGLDSAS